MNNSTVQMRSLGVLILVFAAKAFVFMFIWNQFVPNVFDLPALNYAQSFGILLLSGLAFKNHVNLILYDELTKLNNLLYALNLYQSASTAYLKILAGDIDGKLNDSEYYTPPNKNDEKH